MALAPILAEYKIVSAILLEQMSWCWGVVMWILPRTTVPYQRRRKRLHRRSKTLNSTRL